MHDIRIAFGSDCGANQRNFQSGGKEKTYKLKKLFGLSAHKYIGLDSGTGPYYFNKGASSSRICL